MATKGWWPPCDLCLQDQRESIIQLESPDTPSYFPLGLGVQAGSTLDAVPMPCSFKQESGPWLTFYP